MIKKPIRSPQINQVNPNYYSPDRKKTLAEHIDEIRFRLFWIVVALLLASGVGYLLHKQLLLLAQKPLGSELYYTSPGGGITFIFKLCFSFAVVVALPIVLYHIMRFFFPVVAHIQQRTITRFVVASLILAYAGVAFAYIVSLPAALYFLSNIGDYALSALITVDTYYDFVVSYLLGFALLFQTPIIVLFINKIKPLKPGGMMGAQRYIILFSFIAAAILTPTPDPVNQTIMAMPAIVLYQVSVLLVWWINKRRQPAPAALFSTIPEEVVAAAASPVTLPSVAADAQEISYTPEKPRALKIPVITSTDSYVLKKPVRAIPVSYATNAALQNVRTTRQLRRPVMDIVAA